MNALVLGLQWGDEGKGKAIDYLARDFDVVIRYQGGHNAGHTVYPSGQKVVLHLLPSGIFSPQTASLIGNGVVVDPLRLREEIAAVKKLGFPLGQLVLSDAAPLILPFHQELDIIFEESRYQKIGTTRRGIGPAYEDLTGRRALFVRDLLTRERFSRRVGLLNDYYNRLIGAFGGRLLRVEDYLEEYVAAGEFLRPYVENTVYLLDRYRREGKRILFEGAQGTLLDVSFGTYPYVTSSHPTVSGALCGTGLSAKAIDRVVGITKAYATRVGEGPFPSELFDRSGERLREIGNEFGATTGRPRRVGWLDLVALRYALMVNGADAMFMTKLDVLDDFAEIKVAVAYDCAGVTTDRFDPDPEILQNVRPVYRIFKGWREATGRARSFAELPPSARVYLKFIEEQTLVPVEYVSVGTLREQTIRR